MANSGYSTIRLRRDTTTNWTTGTKNLAYGEVGLDITTGKVRFGQNVSDTAWASAKEVAVGQADNSTTSGTATNLASGSSGSIPYQSGSGTTIFLDVGANTTGSTILLSGGVPTWGKPKITATYFSATTSAELAGVISDETGTGNLVYSNSPSLVTPNIGNQGAVFATSGAGSVTLTAGSGSGSYAIALPNEASATLLTAATAASTYVALSGTQTVTGAKTFNGATTISGTATLSNASVTLSGISGLPGSGTLPVQASSAGALSAAQVSLASHVTGTLPLANGGLGATTVTGARGTLRIYVQSTAPSSPQVGDLWFW